MASRRGYLTQAELAILADITIVDTTEADDQISQAEEIIDLYCGPQDQFIPNKFDGLVSSVGSSTSLTLEAYMQNAFQQDFFVGCWLEVIGGGGIGGRDRITASTYAGVLTLASGISGMDSTTYYRIWQLGRFPRSQDVVFDGRHVPVRYYKQVPELVRRATAMQVEYMINQGPSFFGSDKSNLDQERIGDYQYRKAPGTTGVSQLIAPKAKQLLRGIANRTGAIVD